jgi:hypothetical protein
MGALALDLFQGAVVFGFVLAGVLELFGRAVRV